MSETINNSASAIYSLDGTTSNLANSNVLPLSYENSQGFIITKTANANEFLPGNVVTLPVPTKDGYEFLGWSTKLGSTNYVTVVPATATADYKVYANWEKLDVYSSISYELNGGEISGQAPETYLEGTGCDLPTATKSGYIFLGWTLESNSTAYLTAISKYTTGAVTLYAQWEIDNTFNISSVFNFLTSII